MSLWQFSESSQPLLKLCIEASKSENNNKWLKKFGRPIPVKNDDVNNTIAEESTENIDVKSLHNSQATVLIETSEIPDDIWREIIELDPVVHFNIIVEKCLNSSALYSNLAQNMSLPTVEKFCDQIFGSEKCNSVFIENFYNRFLPVFLKRDNTRLSLNILLEAENYNCMLFKSLLENLFKDLELPSQVLQQYISMLDTNRQSELMNDIILFDISNNVFIHHLHIIHMLYKNCQKTDNLQRYILLKLTDSCQACLHDKNFGRLLLNYLQEQKTYDTDFITIQRIVDSHRSPFKKPCINALNELKKLSE